VDVGCGSGKWVAEVAEQFPNATVHGFDLSLVKDDSFPINTQFHKGDLNHGLPFEDGSIDLVASRYGAQFQLTKES
jgi:ubiquinone/menaquinone biosynthesis C-methylase UbiE